VPAVCGAPTGTESEQMATPSAVDYCPCFRRDDNNLFDERISVIMNSSTHNQSTGKLSIVVSVPAALLWFGVMFFCAKWLLASAAGRLEPGANTSMGALLVFFLLALLLSIGGIYMCIKAWMSKSNLKWQTVSLIGAVVTFWAVCGN
jgi:hypothetical protein